MSAQNDAIWDSLSRINLGTLKLLQFITWSGGNEIWFHTNENKVFVIMFPTKVNDKLRIVERLQDGTEKQIRSIQLSLSRSTHTVKFTGKGTFYGVCSRAGVVSVGGWLASNSDMWTTVATGLPPAAISTFIVVPTDANNNAMKARVTQLGTLDIRLIKPSALECYGDFNIAYIAKQHSLSQLNDKTFFWGGLNKFDVGFYDANDDFSLEFGFVSFIDNRKMMLIFNKYGIELQFLNSDNTNRRTIWKMTAKQLSLSRINGRMGSIEAVYYDEQIR